MNVIDFLIFSVWGGVILGHGGRIIVTKNGKLEIGHCFSNTAMMTIICINEIIIGNNVTVSWNTLIMDTDFYPLLNTKTGDVYKYSKPIHVGNDVWLCTRSVLLKGCVVPNGCVIGANAVVTKQHKN